MDANFSEKGFLNPANEKDKNKCRKFWLLTYAHPKLNKEKKILEIWDKLKKFPHMKNFVFQVEENTEMGYHVHVAIELDVRDSKPVRQFVKQFPKAIIQYIDDIVAAREYSSKKFSRIFDPVFYQIKEQEQDKLIRLGSANRDIKLMLDTVERKVALAIEKKRQYNETEIVRDEMEEVVSLLAKVKKEETQLVKKVKERLSKTSKETSKSNILIEKNIKDITKSIKEIAKLRAEQMQERHTTLSEGEKKWSEINRKVKEGEELFRDEKRLKDKLDMCNGKVEKWDKLILSSKEAIVAQGKILERREKESQVSPSTSPTSKPVSEIQLLQTECNKKDSQLKNLEEKLEKLQNRLEEQMKTHQTKLTELEECIVVLEKEKVTYQLLFKNELSMIQKEKIKQ
jgi:hypothetical protein